MKRWIAATLAMFAFSANAETTGLTTLELFNEVSAICSVTIEGQKHEFRAVRDHDGAADNPIVLMTDAAERADGIFAVARLTFENYRKAGNSSVYRSSDLKSIELRAENALSWGNTSVKRQTAKTMDVLVAVVDHKPLELDAVAFLAEKKGAAAKMVCDSEALLRLMNIKARK